MLRKRKQLKSADKTKRIVLDQLNKYPIRCWHAKKQDRKGQLITAGENEDPEFAESVEEAMLEGDDLFNDISEHQLLSLVKEKFWPAIHYWLEKRHPKYNKTKIEIDQPIDVDLS